MLTTTITKLKAVLAVLAILAAVAVVIAVAKCPTCAGAERSEPERQGPAADGEKQAPIGLEGYCPVCIVEMRRWVPGDPQHRAQYDGRTYHFPNDATRLKFLADPARYVPVLGGDCIVCYARSGKRVPGSVRHAAIHQGRLHLFPSHKEKRAFLAHPAEFAEADLAFGGDCAVCLADAGKRVPGDARFTAIHNGLRYRFPTDRQRRAFLADPGKYSGDTAEPDQDVPKSGSVEHGDEAGFRRQVLEADVPVLVDFYAEWCSACRALAPRLEELARQTTGARIVKIDVDRNPRLAARYGVSAIPNLAVFTDGKITARHTGLADKQRLKELIGG